MTAPEAEIKLTKKICYMIGFFHADGSLSAYSRNRGKFEIELSRKDRKILKKFQRMIPCHSRYRERTRDTNFKNTYRSAILTVNDLHFRNFLKSVGCPVGRKDLIIAPPNPLPYPISYFRGYADGNGSVGFTETGTPFLSVTTNSDAIKDFVLSFLFKRFGLRKKVSRNTRDNIYNIMVTRENAVALSRLLYLRGGLCLSRKKKAAKEIQNWKNPFPKANRRTWFSDEDEIVLKFSVEKAAKKLKRSERSIKMRHWRLNQQRIN